jgi:RluA family pseudouridine synthase
MQSDYETMLASDTDWVLHVDEAILVVNKPPGLPSLPDGYDASAPHLKSLLEREFGPVWIVHRLDRQTSGVIVLARSVASHRHLNTQFEQRQVSKSYHALVSGNPGWEEKTVRLPLRPNGDRRHRTIVDAEKGRPAITELKVKQHYYEAKVCLVGAFPHTGRTHQIRAHLAAIGHPLVADALYGGGKALMCSQILPPTAFSTDIPLMERAALHANSLEFVHPTRSERVSFCAPYPADLARVLHLLGD